MWQQTPRLGGVAMFFALAAMGLPTLASFVGEFLVLWGTFQVSIPFASIAAGGFIVSVIYALWLMQKVFQGVLPPPTPPDLTGARDLSAREWAMLIPAIIILLWLGLYPKTALDLSGPAVSNLQQLSQRPLAGQVPANRNDSAAPTRAGGAP
jgi:NADH-quinone oxidoreductase subunit M